MQSNHAHEWVLWCPRRPDRW